MLEEILDEENAISSEEDTISSENFSISQKSTNCFERSSQDAKTEGIWLEMPILIKGFKV